LEKNDRNSGGLNIDPDMPAPTLGDGGLNTGNNNPLDAAAAIDNDRDADVTRDNKSSDNSEIGEV
jgi:hypothetical protein